MGSMYQAETPTGLCKYKDNEKGTREFVGDSRFFRNFMVCSVNNWFLCLFWRDP